MTLHWNAKDGGAESNVSCWGLELKWLGSILLLRFGEGSREAYHSHAFNSVSWLLKGQLREQLKTDVSVIYEPSRRPIVTRRETFHRVFGLAPASWVLTFRGPWVDKWHEFSNAGLVTLTHGRQVVSQ